MPKRRQFSAALKAKVALVAFRGELTLAEIADMLAILRSQSAKQEVLSTGISGRGCRKTLNILLHAYQQAA